MKICDICKDPKKPSHTSCIGNRFHIDDIEICEECSHRFYVILDKIGKTTMERELRKALNLPENDDLEEITHWIYEEIFPWPNY